jgi:hypothetical protein
MAAARALAKIVASRARSRRDGIGNDHPRPFEENELMETSLGARGVRTLRLLVALPRSRRSWHRPTLRAPSAGR